MPTMDSSQTSLEFEARQIYSISQLNREVKQLLQENFPMLWVEGEISNLARPASGHFYFSLKDEQAQVRCAMFRGANRNLKFSPEDGMHVLVRARIGLYEPRGEYQLTIEHMEEAGIGVLQRRYEALKVKLSAEGLFDEKHKQKIPEFPKTIAVVTSASGAAIRDILSVLQRRYPIINVIIYSVPVQGEDSAQAIVNALNAINKQKSCDVIILARGGGSIEDLWSFNEEEVARAVFASKIPLVTGIGHEVDFTIADFVADIRAATPSAAAELTVPNQEELLDAVQQYESSLKYFLHDYLREQQQTIDWLSQRLVYLHPRQSIKRKILQVADFRRRIKSSIMLAVSERHSLFNALLLRFESQSPESKIQLLDDKLISLYKSLRQCLISKHESSKHQLMVMMRTLDAISPLRTLNRGYAIVTHAENQQIIRNAEDVTENEKILIQLAVGRLSARVTNK